MKVSNNFEYEVFSSESELNYEQQSLLRKAKRALQKSYSPYSEFKVAAALELSNGEVVTGTNQENMAYPSGLCAERVAFFYAKSKYPEAEILRVAITAESDNYRVSSPITPCGACRQVMLEYEIEQEKDVEIILQGESGDVFLLQKIKHLIPLHFFERGLRK